jgi:cobalt-zinc-cadmium efflux system outer membrane protein
MRQNVFIVWGAAITLLGAVSFANSRDRPSDANSLIYLPDYLRYAALHNAGLSAAFERWKATLDVVPQAKSLPDPRFTYGYFIDEVETRVGPQRQKLGIAQTFPWFGKIEAKTDAAAAAAKAAYKRYESAKLKLFYQVKEAFYEYAYLGRAVEIARQNLELLKHFEEVARTKYIAAAGSHPDIIRVQIELATLADRLESTEQMQEPIVTKLNSALNRESSLPLLWPVRQQFKPIPINREKLIAKLRANNPELKALDFERAAAESRVELAKKRFYPDISVGLDWIQTDDARTVGTSDSGKDPIMAMISMNLPIWQDSYKAGRHQAEAKLRRVSAQKLQKENDIIAQTAKVLYEFEDSGRKVALYTDTLIPKAKEMLEASEVAYRAGTVDFLSLIDAQRTLLAFELLYERSVTDYLQRLAELEMLAGGKIKEATEGNTNW